MKHNLDLASVEDDAQMDRVNHLVRYLEYAISDVQELSPIGASLLVLVIDCIKQEDEDRSKPLLS